MVVIFQKTKIFPKLPCTLAMLLTQIQFRITKKLSNVLYAASIPCAVIRTKVPTNHIPQEVCFCIYKYLSCGQRQQHLAAPCL